MASTKNSSRSGKLSIFANSPLGTRLFSLLIILLIVAAAGWAFYTLSNKDESSAASRTKKVYPLYDLVKTTTVVTHINLISGSSYTATDLKTHFYTAFKCEKNYLVEKKGYKVYRISAYVPRTTSAPPVCDNVIDDDED